MPAEMVALIILGGVAAVVAEPVAQVALQLKHPVNQEPITEPQEMAAPAQLGLILGLLLLLPLL